MQRLLKESSAQHVGLSFHSLVNRLPKKKQWLVSEKFEPTQEVYLASGGHTFKTKKTVSQVQDFLDAFEMFVENNAANLALVTECDAPMAPVERTVHRTRMQALLGERFAPVWDPETGARGLEWLAERHGTVGLPSSEVRESPVLSARLVPLANRYGTRWHALDGARPDDLATGRYASAATTAWLSPMRWGETIVWDGTRMVRYQTAMKDQARRRHRSTFRLAGFDADRILGDDHEEISRFTVWSFARLEEAVSRRKPPSAPPFSVIQGGGEAVPEELSTPTTWNNDMGMVEHPPAVVDNTAVVVRNEASRPAVRQVRATLPVVSFEKHVAKEFDEDGNQIQVERNLTRKGKAVLRQCDTCFISAACPMFEPGSECAYDLPLEIKTKEQLNAVNYMALEMQVERVAFMRLAEELNGGYADPNLSSEMDRLLRMQEQIKKIEDTSETFKLSVEAKGGAGILSRLLGEKVQSNNALAAPVDPAQIIQGYTNNA